MRSLVSGFAFGVCALGLVAVSASAQYVISAHSGVVQYVEGRAYLDNQPVDPKFGQFPAIKNNQEFRTGAGRAEILLTPGVFLRLGEDSSIRMLSNSLTDTRVEMLAGSAMVECDDVPKDNSIETVYKGNVVRFEKQGLYRIDAEPARLRVYEGEAVVTDASGNLTVRSGKATNLDGVLQAENFDRKNTDSLYNWSDRRAAYVAKANVVSASTASNGSGGYGGYGGYGALGGVGGLGGLGYGGLGYSGLGYGYYDPSFMGGWMFNPLFGMYTFMPYSGFGYSPFGYTYYSPYTVGYAPIYGGGSSAYTTTRVSRVSGITGATRMAGISTAGRGALARGGSFGSAARGGGGFGGGHASFSGGGVGHAGGGGHR
ncbi:MAG TPA: hypothetical protein VME17_21695 [Bryobacteraceae bacterium]|nr:hypothetical protein [Bryobacteraceae bacterium]